MPKVAAKGLALKRAHSGVLVKRLACDLEKLRQNQRFILLRLFHSEDLGKTAERVNGDVVRHLVVCCDLSHGCKVALEHRAIERDGDVSSLREGNCDKHVHLAAGHSLFHKLLDVVFGKGVKPGQLHRAVEIAVVHRPDLDGDLLVFKGGNGPSVACHAFYQEINSFFGYGVIVSRERIRSGS